MGITSRDVPPEVWAKLCAAAPPAKGKARRENPALPTLGERAAAAVASWCESRGWDAPATEFRFAPPRKWRFDLAWVVRLVAVEFQGGIWACG